MFELSKAFNKILDESGKDFWGKNFLFYDYTLPQLKNEFYENPLSQINKKNDFCDFSSYSDKETSEKVYQFKLEGFDKKDIKIEIEKNKLNVYAKREEKEGIYQHLKSEKSFSILLNEKMQDCEKDIKVTFKDGILEIKTPPIKENKIELKIN